MLADIEDCAPSTAEERNPHVLVCVFGETIDCELIHQGRALADLMRGRLTVLYPFTVGADDRNRSELQRDRMTARAASAQLIELPAYSHLDGIVEYANTRGITHLVLSDRPSGSWHGPRSDSLPERLVERLDAVDLYLLTGSCDTGSCDGPVPGP